MHLLTEELQEAFLVHAAIGPLFDDVWKFLTEPLSRGSIVLVSARDVIEGCPTFAQVGQILHEEHKRNLIFTVLAFRVLSVLAVAHLFEHGDQCRRATRAIEPAVQMPLGFAYGSEKDVNDLTLVPFIGHREVSRQAKGRGVEIRKGIELVILIHLFRQLGDLAGSDSNRRNHLTISGQE